MGERKRITMTVPEMRKMLGLKKTESYWLVHRGFFETITINGKMRIVIESFEKWYANQIKWKKVDGPPPGEELRAYSYSPQEIADELGVSNGIIYDLIKKEHIETFTVDTWIRVRKDVFEDWYQNQTRYRTKQDRERDVKIEAETMTMPEMARLLVIPRSEVYRILLGDKGCEVFQFVYIGDRRRVTKESFERWYAGQSKYRKLCDRSPEEQEAIRESMEATAKEKIIEKHPRMIVDETKPVFSMQEVAIILDITYEEVRRLIRRGELEARKYGVKYLIPRDDVKWFLFQHRMDPWD